MVVASQYEFSPGLSDKNMLSLVPGDRVIVIDRTTGYAQGWWKAWHTATHKIGYIPKDFVEVIQPIAVELEERLQLDTQTAES